MNPDESFQVRFSVLTVRVFLESRGLLWY